MCMRLACGEVSVSTGSDSGLHYSIGPCGNFDRFSLFAIRCLYGGTKASHMKNDSGTMNVPSELDKRVRNHW